MRLQKNKCLWGVGLGLLFPLFFQLSGGIYRDFDPIIDSQGVIGKLPLPISVFTYVALVALLAGKLDRIRPAVATITGMIVACLLSFWLAHDGTTQPQRKLIMAIQVAFPMGGLLLGLLIEDRDKIIARAFFLVLSVMVPLQLVATWLQGRLILTHYLYGFSIYSHFQYVTLIFVCAFVYALVSLWDEYRVWLCAMIVIMLIYATASLSFLTIFAYITFLTIFGVSKLWPYRDNAKLVFISLALTAVLAAGGLVYFKSMDGERASIQDKAALFNGKFKILADGRIPPNLQERFNDWKFFGAGIVESRTTLLLGHPQPMPREVRSSPHNWYIDIAYTFGLIGLVPILMLIAYTVYLCWKQRKTLPAATWWVAGIVLYLVLVDSNFKVTLRQPYPGIFAYFMWGLLLTRLRGSATSRLSA